MIIIFVDIRLTFDCFKLFVMLIIFSKTNTSLNVFTLIYFILGFTCVFDKIVGLFSIFSCMAIMLIKMRQFLLLKLLHRTVTMLLLTTTIMILVEDLVCPLVRLSK